MKILTDVDGVLLNWTCAFHEWLKEQGETIDESAIAYDLEHCYPSLTKSQMNSAVECFNASARMGFLAPYADAVHYVRKMYEEHGVTLNCISSMGGDVYSRRLRKRNLNRLFGNAIDEIVLLPLLSDKHEELTRWKDSGYVWLEDNINNAECGDRLGLRSFLFNHPYNTPISIESESHFERINNWKELYETLF